MIKFNLRNFRNFLRSKLIKPRIGVNVYQSKYLFSTSDQNNQNKNEDFKKDSSETNNNYHQHETESINYEQHPILKYFFSKNIKTKKLPCFEVYSSQIEILNQPMDFYLALIKLIRNANERITLSSLYLGIGKMEELIVEELIKALKKNPKLKITILLDRGRGLRYEKNKNSHSLLKKIMTETYPFNRNVKIAYFLNPNIGHIHTLLPGVISEVTGVLHSKIFISDNTTIITGANLSQNYFTNRQDRYFVIQDCEPFSDYCDDYTKALTAISLCTDSKGDLYEPKTVPNPYKNKKNYLETISQQFKMFKYNHRVKIARDEELTMNDYFNNLEKYNSNYNYRVDEKILLEHNFTSNKKEFLLKLIEEQKQKEDSFVKMLEDLQLRDKSEDSSESTKKEKIEPEINEKASININPLMKVSGTNKVLIFPSFQFTQINQKDEYDILTGLLEEDLNIEKIVLSSGYFNFPNYFIEDFRKSKGDYNIEIVTSAPKCNSFYKAGFIKKNIPIFYRVFLDKILKINKSDKKLKNKFSVFEYFKEGWSFHSKGMWFYEKGREQPNLTIIGSSNYNYRSFERDIESQFYIYSFCDNFSKKLHKETDEIFHDSMEIDRDFIRKDKDSKIKLKHKFWAKILEKYL